MVSGALAPTLTAGSTAGTVANIEILESLAGNDLIIGTTGAERYVVRDGSGSDLIYTSGGEDRLDLTQLSSLTSVDPTDGKVTIVTSRDGSNITQTLKVIGALRDILMKPGDKSKLLKGSAPLAGGDPVSDNLVSVAVAGTATPNVLLDADVPALAAEARARWAPLLSVADEAKLAAITFLVVTDLTDAAGGRVLSRTVETSPGAFQIQLDAGGMGWGWFKDATPADDAEFDAASGTPLLTAKADGSAEEVIDALTVIMHEMGHVLGVDHLASADALMNSTLDTGERIDLSRDGMLALSDQQQITAGLEKLATWVQGFAAEIDDKLATEIPFTDTTIGDLVVVNGTGATTGARITNWISAQITAQVASYFAANPTTADAAGLAAASGGVITRSTGSNLEEFEATLTLGGYNGTFTVDLSGASFGGIGLDDGGNPLTLQLDVNMALTFRFGIDADNHFYVSSPGLDFSIALGEASALVTGVDLSANSFAVSGSPLGTLAAGDVIFVSGAGTSYGNFTVVSATLSAGVTTIVVGETIPQSDLDGAAGDPPTPLIGEARIWSTFDLTAKLGPIAIAIEDGTITFDASLHLGADTVLDAATLSDVSTATFDVLIGDPVLGGSTQYHLDLPIVLNTPFAGFSGEVGRISATSPALPEGASDLGQFIASIPSTLEVESSLGDLLSLRSISLDQLLDGLISAIDALSEDGGVLYETIPEINRSLADLLGDGTDDLLEQLRAVVVEVRDSLENIQELESLLNAQFNDVFEVFGDDLNPIQLTYEGSVLALDFDLSLLYEETFGFDLNLEDYLDLSAFEEAGFPITLTGSAEVDVSAFLGIHLGAAFDLSNVLSPTFTISEDSGIDVSLEHFAFASGAITNNEVWWHPWQGGRGYGVCDRVSSGSGQGA
jgi:hypothetical protein